MYNIKKVIIFLVISTICGSSKRQDYKYHLPNGDVILYSTINEIVQTGEYVYRPYEGIAQLNESPTYWIQIDDLSTHDIYSNDGMSLSDILKNIGEDKISIVWLTTPSFKSREFWSNTLKEGFRKNFSIELREEDISNSEKDRNIIKYYYLDNKGNATYVAEGAFANGVCREIRILPY